MLIVMCGWPYSGKSTFVRALANEFESKKRDFVIADPTIAYPDDIDLLPQEKRSEYAIAAFNVIVEQAGHILMTSDNNTIVILDTTGSNSNVIGPIIDAAAINGHRTLFIKVESSIAECKKRAGTKWLDKEAENKYKDRFNSNVNFLEGICHSSITVINEGITGKANIEKQARDLSRRIHQQVE